MELTRVEVAALENTVEQIGQAHLNDLSDLQLALVGGGIGDVIVG